MPLKEQIERKGHCGGEKFRSPDMSQCGLFASPPKAQFKLITANLDSYIRLIFYRIISATQHFPQDMIGCLQLLWVMTGHYDKIITNKTVTSSSVGSNYNHFSVQVFDYNPVGAAKNNIPSVFHHNYPKTAKIRMFGFINKKQTYFLLI